MGTHHLNELLTPSEMADCDRAAIAAGIPGLVLMDRAGTAVADAVAALVNPPARVAVLCGPGNNGGDGFVAARRLADVGYDVRLGLLGAVETVGGDASVMARRWTGAIEPAAAGLLEGADIIVDAIFGAGLSRPVEGAARELVEAMSVSPARIVAVDVPSGLDGATGEVRGAAAPADATVTFFRAKPGHYLMPGRDLVGRLSVVDIGIPAGVLGPLGIRTVLNAPRVWEQSFPKPQRSLHKYNRGHAVVLSGTLNGTGAARLAARAALRIGAGLVTIASPPEALAVNAAQLTAIMIEPVASIADWSRLLDDRRKSAVLIGPAAGVGSATEKRMHVALASSAAMVLDADAITTAANAPTALFDAIARRASPVVMTPHDGEFARLFPDLAGDKLTRARLASQRSGAVIVLKGADTVVAAPDGRAAINANAPPWLATAGSGDVLAGCVTGLLAQRMPAFEAALAAVYLHGAAADRLGPGLIAEDLPEAIPGILDVASSRFSSAHRL
ncbi:MAG: NAD(P)H-hydrate dehydratase [Hyphomicrobiaceae bacterium]